MEETYFGSRKRRNSVGRQLKRKWGGVRERLRDPDSRGGAIAVLALAVVVLLGFGYWIKFVSEIPSVAELRDIRRVEASVVYTADGEELARYHDKNRTWVPLDSISVHMVNALLATEDHRFYEHWGIDIRRTFSSLWKTAQGDRQGGSTISMQLARNAFDEIGDDFPVERKLKEYFTALQLETLYSKDEILEMYLNSVPFMYGTFGVEAAARTYFQKRAYQLDLPESSTLVGMLKGTVIYNPVRNPEASHERRNVVFTQMVRRGVLTQEEADALADEPTELNFRRMTHEDNLAPHFAEHLRIWLDDWADRRGYNLYIDGLRIHTTIDASMQSAAEGAVREVMDDLQAVVDVEWSRQRPQYFSGRARDYRSVSERVEPFAYFWGNNEELVDRLVRRSERFDRLVDSGATADSALVVLRQDSVVVDSLKNAFQRLEAGFVAIDPRNGHVKAWVGGRDYRLNKYDHVSISRRQPGSTFKPFVYAAALEYGYSPEDVMRDEVVEYVDPQTGRRWAPRNVGSASGEPITLRDALAYSKNTVTAQLMHSLGPDRVADYAHRMGIESEMQRFPSLGLGTSEVSLLELVTAYTTIASGGTRRSPVIVTRIEDRHGRALATFSSESQGAMSPSTAYTVLDMLRGAVDYGTGQRVRSMFGVRGDVAGKTGTSQDGADGWFVLMHPNLVTGAWVGFPSRRLTFRSNYWGQGGHNALHAVGQFLRSIDLPSDASFTAPPGYRPPASSRFASLYDSLYDSLDALAYADSIGWGDSDDSAWRDIDDLPSAGDVETEDQPAFSNEELLEEMPEEELSEVEELNRQARERSSVGRILERMEDD